MLWFADSIGWTAPILLLTVYGIIRYFIRSQKDEPDQINWSPLETICIAFAIYLVSQIMGGLIAYIIPLAYKGWSLDQASSWLEKNIYGQFILVLAIETLAVLMLFYFLKRRRSNFKALGLKKPKWRDLAYVLLGFVIYFAAYILILAVLKKFVTIDTNQQQQIGFDNATNSQLPFVFISLVILPPFVEELLVRGFLYSGLKKGLPILWAVLITSAMFAIAHLQIGNDAPLLWSAAIDTFVLSLVLIYLKEKTGSLAASIGLHMLKNLIAFVGIFVLHLS